MKEIYFEVPGEPQGKQRARTVKARNGRSTTFTPGKTIYYENLIKVSYNRVTNMFFENEIKVDIAAYYSIPKSTPKKKHQDMISGVIKPMKKPDLDNIAKAVCDSLNGIAYKDDSQIIELRIRKEYAAVPGLFITIRGN